MHSLAATHEDDYPGSLEHPETVNRRQQMLAQPHMRALAEYVERLRSQDNRLFVPDFDPLDGGVNARLLFLFEKPGPKTFPPLGSRFISRNNNDPTAKHTHRIMLDARVPRKETIIWNIVPWWNGQIKMNSSEKLAGALQLRALLRVLPNLRAAVLVGRQAEEFGAPQLDGTGIEIYRSVHPSQQSRNGLHSREGWLKLPKTWGGAWEEVQRTA